MYLQENTLFWWFKIANFNITLGLVKLWIFFGGGGGVGVGWVEGGHRKIGLFLEVIDIHFSFFSYGQRTELDFFFFFLGGGGGGGLLHFKYILGMPDIPDIFWAKQ